MYKRLEDLRKFLASKDLRFTLVLIANPQAVQATIGVYENKDPMKMYFSAQGFGLDSELATGECLNNLIEAMRKVGYL